MLLDNKPYPIGGPEPYGTSKNFGIYVFLG